MDYSKINKLNLLGTIINADESGVLATADQIYDKNTGKSTQDSVKDLKEAIATINANIGNALHYVGETSTAITEGSNPANDNGEAEIDIIFYDGGSYNTTTKKYELKTHTEKHKPKSGDVVIYGQTEFIYATVEYTSLTEGTMTKSYWHELGSTGSLKALAFKDNATGSVTPAGTVASAFKGTAATISISSKGTLTPTAKVDVYEAGASTSDIGLTENAVGQNTLFTPKAKFTGTAATLKPTGSITYTGGSLFVQAGTPGQSIGDLASSVDKEEGSGSLDGNHPNASAATELTATAEKPTVTTGTVDASKVTSVGTLPSLGTTVVGETLQITFNAGTLPAKTDVKALSSVAVAAPAVKVSPIFMALDNVKATVATSVNYTPAGSVAVGPMVLDMSTMNVAVSGSTSYTPAGSVTSAFTGTAATITVK